MKERVITYFVVLLLILLCVGCSKESSIDKAQGIHVVSTEELEKIDAFDDLLCALKGYDSLQDVVVESDGLAKFRVDKRTFIHFDLDLIGDNGMPVQQPGTIYDVTIIDSFYGLNLSQGDQIKIFANHSPEDFLPNSICLIEGNTYIAFFHELQPIAPKSLLLIIDYNFFDDEFGIIPCRENSQYLIHDMIKNELNMSSSKIDIGKSAEEKNGVLSYFNTEMTQFNYQAWNIVTSNNLEDELLLKCEEYIKRSGK